MKQVFKVIKINLLAIVAFPILLIALASKLISKALEKALIIFATILLFGGYIFVMEAVDEIIHGGGIIATILMFVGFLLVFGLIIGLLSIPIVAVAQGGIVLFDGIYSLVFDGYSTLYMSAKKTYDELPFEKGTKILCGIFYNLLDLIYSGIMIFLKHSLKTMIILSVCVVFGILYWINLENIKDDGISLLAFLKQQDVVYNISFCLGMVILLGGIVVVLVSLGIEWQEWAEEMQQENILYFGIDSSRIADKLLREQVSHRAKVLMDMLLQYDDFSALINEAIVSEAYPQLPDLFEEYKQKHDDILRKLNKNMWKIKESKANLFIQDVDAISHLQVQIAECFEQSKGTSQGYSDDHGQPEAENTNEAAQGGMFFEGCDTLEQLQKRFHVLSKAFHPDSEMGDEHSFIRMKAEYEAKKSALENVSSK